MTSKNQENQSNEKKCPLVSVIVPCYNVEGCVGRCLDSLLANDYPHKEIITIDDGSTDSTLKLLKQYGEKYDCIRVMTHVNRGVGLTRTRGLEAAKGDYVMIVDSDDTVSPGFISQPVTVIEERKLDMLMFGFSVDWECNGKMRESRPKNRYGCNSPKEILKDVFPRFYGISIDDLQRWLDTKENVNRNREGNYVWRWIYRKSFLDCNNLRFQNIRVGEDTVFINECLLKATKIDSIDDCLYNYYPCPTGLMKSNIGGVKMYANKIVLLNARIKIGKMYEKLTGKNALPLYGGEFTKYNGIRTLSLEK